MISGRVGVGLGVSHYMLNTHANAASQELTETSAQAQGSKSLLYSPSHTIGSSIARTSTFELLMGTPKRLTLSVHLLFEDFPSKIWDHLASILNQFYSSQARRTGFINTRGRRITPANLLGVLQDEVLASNYRHKFETGSLCISQSLYHMVRNIFVALTA
jgi:hypothetical protein